MLMRILVRCVSVIVATQFLLTGVASNAGAGVAEEKKPEPSRTTKKSKGGSATVSVTSGRGGSKGIFSLGSRSSTDPDRKDRYTRVGGGSKKKVPDAQRRAVQDACWRQLQDVLCFDNGGDPLQALGLTGPVARAMAVQLITRLQLPTPQPQFGPNPNDNEWNMLTVGYPIWLWTNGPTTVTTTTSGYGFTFHMTARWRSTTFHTGDQHTVTCTRMTTYTTTVKPGSPSPTCGHTYQKPSLPKGHYTVQAIANWDVTWTVAGLTGTLPAHNQATATIPIGELTALNR